MDIAVTFLFEGGLAIDCGDEHRALALWLEQGWQDAEFRQQLRQVHVPAALPMTIQGAEFHAYISRDEVLVEANLTELQEGLGKDESVIDASAGCGYEDFIDVLDYLYRCERSAQK